MIIITKRLQITMKNILNSYITQPNEFYPLTFILKNNASQNKLSFSYLKPTTNINTCAEDSMHGNTVVNIHIEPAYNLTQLIITYVINNIIMFSTYNPIIEPTLLHTKYPTVPMALCIGCEINISSTTQITTTNILTLEIEKDDKYENNTQLNIFGQTNHTLFVLQLHLKTSNSNTFIKDFVVTCLSINLHPFNQLLLGSIASKVGAINGNIMNQSQGLLLISTADFKSTLLFLCAFSIFVFFLDCFIL